MATADKPGASQVTFLAAADLERYRCVDLDDTGKAKYANGERFVGVTMGPVKSGQAATICLPQGIAMIEAGAAITAGASVVPDATGRVVPGEGAGMVGCDAAASAGQIISVVLGVYEYGEE